MVVREPQAADDYDDRTTAAVKSVLIEIGQILGSFEGKFAIIGGAVPWLLLGEAEMQHVGTADVDLGLDPVALGDGEYVRLVEALQEHGYLVIFSAYTSSGSSCRCVQDACAIFRAGAQQFGHALQNRVIDPIGTGVVDGFGNQVRQHL